MTTSTGLFAFRLSAHLFAGKCLKNASLFRLAQHQFALFGKKITGKKLERSQERLHFFASNVFAELLPRLLHRSHPPRNGEHPFGRVQSR